CGAARRAPAPAFDARGVEALARSGVPRLDAPDEAPVRGDELVAPPHNRLAELDQPELVQQPERKVAVVACMDAGRAQRLAIRLRPLADGPSKAGERSDAVGQQELVRLHAVSSRQPRNAASSSSATTGSRSSSRTAPTSRIVSRICSTCVTHGAQ